MALAWKAFDELLIYEIQKYPVLYNKSLKEFKDKKLKDNAWNASATKLGAKGQSCFGG